MQAIQKILIIRFRQIGDSVLAVALCSSLRKSFPEAEIHFILNKGIAPMFEGHPSIDRIITFDKEENKSLKAYLSRIWNITHSCKYDLIIDMRSTIRTLFFSLFSLNTPFRIGRTKPYARFLLTHRVDVYDEKWQTDMATRNLSLLSPLEKWYPMIYTKEFELFFTNEEIENYRLYMGQQGVDFNRLVMLVGVTTKLPHKKWKLEYMKETLQKIMNKYPDLQLIFNYAPGEEEKEAREMFNELGSPPNILIEVQANSLRQLGTLCANCSFYFGNEGGTRHIAQAMGIPSFAIFSPNSSKTMWLPVNSVPCAGIEPKDVLLPEQLQAFSYEDKYDSITAEKVLECLVPMIDRL